MRQVAAFDPRSGVGDFDHGSGSFRSSCNADRSPGARHAQRVLHEVRDDLAHAVRVALDHKLLGKIRRQCEARVGGLVLMRGDRLAQGLRQVDRTDVEVELGRPDAREVHHILNHVLQPIGLRADHTYRFGVSRAALDRTVFDRFRVTADRGDRCAQLVRHAGQKLALASLRFRKRARHIVERDAERRQLLVLRDRDALRQVAFRDARSRFGYVVHRTSQPLRQNGGDGDRDGECDQGRNRDAEDQRSEQPVRVGNRPGEHHAGHGGSPG